MKKNKKAFTLIELLVVIAIIGIIAVSAQRLNFKNISDRQRLDSFFYQVRTNIETIQNNALIGKAVNIGTQSNPILKVPKEWLIKFNNSGSGKIIPYYKSGAIYVEDNNNKIIPKKFQQIKIECKNKTQTGSLTDTGTLVIQGGNLSLSGGCDDDKKILELNINYKQFKKILLINTISGVIEEEKK